MKSMFKPALMVIPGFGVLVNSRKADDDDQPGTNPLNTSYEISDDYTYTDVLCLHTLPEYAQRLL